MPFNLYKTVKSGDDLEYFAPRLVQLAGRGLIQKTAKRYNENLDHGWTISEMHMLETEGVATDESSLVIDTSPSRNTINLYQIRSISGFSYATWTPIMIIFEQLFADFEVDLQKTSVSEFKCKFKDGSCSRSKVRTFLYLTGGFDPKHDCWNFGGNSRTTGALLREDAWDYFSKVV